VFSGCTSLTNVTIGNGVSSIPPDAFQGCSQLNRVTIPNSITTIGSYAFQSCSSLVTIYFQGNAPSADSTIFNSDGNLTAYYLPGTTGWNSTYSGFPTVLWNPQAQNDANFGVRSNAFGFNIIGPSNLVIVVEASTNFANPVWQPLQTNTLTGGSSYFSDPKWTNYPGRFYRLRSP
jgi:hypothetical protein